MIIFQNKAKELEQQQISYKNQQKLKKKECNENDKKCTCKIQVNPYCRKKEHKPGIRMVKMQR